MDPQVRDLRERGVADELRDQVVADGKELHQDTLYHLGVDVGTKARGWSRRGAAGGNRGLAYLQAREDDVERTPLHELWLQDPGGNLVEVYARLTEGELAAMPAGREPVMLAGGDRDLPKN
ncbi:MAG: hypothetical protein R3F39_20705 [Myxococcota bacterium]